MQQNDDDAQQNTTACNCTCSWNRYCAGCQLVGACDLAVASKMLDLQHPESM
ncbi:MAG: hypothetical protein CM1200mP30_11090 [Pseudomonadota bacterium]|nr:MAG: hypothetical protein CM1200mP30_11090 [Pseudomonadota bacterium]